VNGIVPDIKIAIVDHDEDRRNAFERVLKSAEFPAGKFSSAEEFLASLDRRTTSCLILDVRLPGMSGIELQNPFRETTEPVPVIFITAEGARPSTNWSCMRELWAF
jgi:FixJ family two-component response regulator